MVPIANRSMALVITLAILASSGCGGPKAGPGSKPPPRTKSQLGEINLAYFNSQAIYGRLPKTELELERMILGVTYPESAVKHAEECLAEVRKGTYEVAYPTADIKKVENEATWVVVYESKAKESGGFVAFYDGNVAWMSAADLKKSLESQANASAAEPEPQSEKASPTDPPAEPSTELLPDAAESAPATP
jgi:hypothetical protein